MVFAPERVDDARDVRQTLCRDAPPALHYSPSSSSSSSSFVLAGRSRQFAGWKKDEWRKQATGVSLVPPEKRPRTKDDDEDEDDWDRTLNIRKGSQSDVQETDAKNLFLYGQQSLDCVLVRINFSQRERSEEHTSELQSP